MAQFELQEDRIAGTFQPHVIADTPLLPLRREGWPDQVLFAIDQRFRERVSIGEFGEFRAHDHSFP